jgi:hypothetical protein
MKSKLVELRKVVEFIRQRQESNRQALMHVDDESVLRARHRHDVLKELADAFESGTAGI